MNPCTRYFGNLRSRSQEHLTKNQVSYRQHLSRALRYSFKLSVASAVLFIHAIFPAVFEQDGSNIVSSVHNDLLVHEKKEEEMKKNEACGREELRDGEKKAESTEFEKKE